jgi:hypothetical protein
MTPEDFDLMLQGFQAWYYLPHLLARVARKRGYITEQEEEWINNPSFGPERPGRKVRYYQNRC